MNKNRRNFLRQTMIMGGAGWASRQSLRGQHQHPQRPPAASKPKHEHPEARAATTEDFLPVHTPDLPALSYEIDNGVKVFHLVAEPVKREFIPGRVVDLWGYNGTAPGPTIEVTEGDRVRLIVDNHLPEPTSMHWHGFEVPIEMDGVPGVTQDPIEPGGRFIYEFTLHQNGTFFYHSHMPMQEMLGMIGLFIMHPKRPHHPGVDKDFGIILQEWAILPNNTIPNTLSMEFNWLTMNGKAGPATTPLIVKKGERVRLRFVNLGMDHHPIHLHGHQFYITGTEGGRVPETAWYPTNTALVGVAQAKDLEFDAVYPGDWMLHCHLPHHMMNQMVSMVGPMSHVGPGMHANMGMEAGMGIVEGAHALSEELGPALGRTIGPPAFERETSHLVGRPATASTAEAQHSQHAGGPDHSVNPWTIPGYPQDMFMVMDEIVAKPETYGLRPTWSAGVMGMMTLVRVLEEDLYEEVMKRVREGKAEQPSKSMEHDHGNPPGE